jgi:hypothetical protein
MRGMPKRTSARWLFAVVGALLIVGAVALPALAEDPGTEPGPAATGKPDHAGRPAWAGRFDRAGGPPWADSNLERGTPRNAVTLTGVVGSRTDDTGRTVYTLTVGSVVYDLKLGPPWWWGDTHPLQVHMGKSTEIVGMQPEGRDVIHVRSVAGEQLRGAGRPPWAGGWKLAGERHPGWTREKADRWAAKFGDGRPGWGPGGRPDKPADED